jgi:hypothetical protein
MLLIIGFAVAVTLSLLGGFAIGYSYGRNSNLRIKYNTSPPAQQNRGPRKADVIVDMNTNMYNGPVFDGAYSGPTYRQTPQPQQKYIRIGGLLYPLES